MNTFFNLQQIVSVVNREEITRHVEILKKIPIHRKIYNRGAYEQYRIRYYPNYTGNGSQVKRIIKNYFDEKDQPSRFLY